jgi:hypothetical protein
MQFNKMTNRNGLIVFTDNLMTNAVRNQLVAYGRMSLENYSQDELVDIVVSANKSSMCNSEDFRVATAIFLNAKNYLIEDAGELIEALVSNDLELYIDMHNCIQPMGLTQDKMIRFIPHGELEKTKQQVSTPSM